MQNVGGDCGFVRRGCRRLRDFGDFLFKSHLSSPPVPRANYRSRHPNQRYTQLRRGQPLASSVARS